MGDMGEIVKDQVVLVPLHLMHEAAERLSALGQNHLSEPLFARINRSAHRACAAERTAFEQAFSAKGRPLTRADYDPDAYGNAFDDGAWEGWKARATLEPAL